jgi:PAS domain S-box-containing protein
MVDRETSQGLHLTTPVSYEEYQSLFENMLNGFAYCQMIYDAQGKPIDFIYLQVNESFENITGLKKKEITGKRVTEVFTEIKETYLELFEIYGTVASEGKPQKFETIFQATARIGVRRFRMLTRC